MWPQIAMFVISMAFTFLMRPKPPKVKPPSANEVKAPQIGEGRPIGVAFGRPWIHRPTCIWYGNLSIVAIKKKGGK